MRREPVKIVLIIVVLVLLLSNMYVVSKYDINLFKYIRYLDGLSKNEREWLREHGSIIYGADQNSPPLRYLDEKSGQYKGVVVDYIRVLSIELGAEIEFKPLIWEDALKSLSEGETDVCDMFPSKERQKHYLFSDPIYNLRGIVLVSRSEKEIKTYKDLRGKKVAVAKGDYAIEFLNQNVSNIDYVFVPDNYHAIQYLIQGRVRAVVGDEPVISYFTDKMNIKEKVKIIDPPMYELSCVLAVPKSRVTLLNILNKGIFSLKRKNIIEKIQQKWFGISAPISMGKVSEKITVILGIFVSAVFAMAYVSYIWNNTLKQEVMRKTEELEVSRNDLKTIIDGLTHFLIVIDEGCNIVNANKSFLKFAGRERHSVIGKRCSNFSSVIPISCDGCLIKQTFRKATQLKKELKYGGRIYQVRTFPITDKNNRVVKVIIVVEDITELKANERQLLQANKMAAIGQLAAGVAHEIRNPLGLIRNYSYIIKNALVKKDERILKAISVIEDSVDKASNIIDNLLNFSRISDDKYDWVNMHDLITSILELENKVMIKQNIKWKFECDPKLRCYTNQESLKHILINLISNAIDAMPDGGMLQITCRLKNNMLTVTCSDTGTGIKDEHLEQIFHPFFTTKGPGKGTGLGLYITYNEVQKLGGDIRVTSKAGKGTTFEVMIPVKGRDNHGVQ